MRLIKKIFGLVFAFVICLALQSYGQIAENCTNGIDDDGDGLVDCQDQDCQGPVFQNFAYPTTISSDAKSVDLDNDGDLDVLVSGNEFGSHVYLNDGAGNFQVNYTFPIPSVRRCETCDIDNDGDMDALFAIYDGLVIFINDGLGNFLEHTHSVNSQQVYDVACGDLDNDGFSDLWIAIYDNAFDSGADEVWINTANSDFVKTGQDIGTNRSRAVSLGDVDMDGDLDALVANSFDNQVSNGILLWLNDGNGFFTQGFMPLVNQMQDVDLVDLDGDGDLDFCAVYVASNTSVIGFNTQGTGFALSYVSNGNLDPVRCAFGDVVEGAGVELIAVQNNGGVYYSNWTSGTNFSPFSFISDSNISTAYFCTSGDFNGDQLEDLFVVGEDKNYCLLKTSSANAPSFSLGPPLELAYSERSISKVFDYDLDGDDDLILACSEGSSSQTSLKIFENTSDLGVLDFVLGEELFTDRFTDVEISDFNNDSLPDLYLAKFGGNDVYCLNNNGAYSAVQISNSFYSRDSAVGDFDNDGDTDVVLVSQQFVTYVRNNNNSLEVFGSSFMAGDYKAVEAGDIDGDGDLDLALLRNGFSGNPYGPVVWAINNGSAQFAAHSQTLSFAADTINGEDFDNDGDLDFYLGNYGGSDSVALNDGFGNFSIIIGDWATGVATSVELADFNSDGLVDVFRTTSAEGQPNQIIYNIGDGVFEAALSVGAGGVFTNSQISDLDNDGKLDLVLGPSGSSSITKVLLNVNSCNDADGDGIPDVCDFDFSQISDCDLDGQEDSCQSDQDNDGVIDPCDDDIDDDGIGNECDFDYSSGEDCDLDGQLDSCQIAGEPTLDCDNSGVLDFCELESGASSDCNGNQIPDSCDISIGSSGDCDSDLIPDDCEVDQDQDGSIDDCDSDIDGDGVSNKCDATTSALEDCDNSGVADSCEIDQGLLSDCDLNGVPDNCEYTSADDCNSNGLLDSCDILVGISQDCSGNGIPDECEIQSGSVADCNSNGVPDQCDYLTDPDCNSNGILDSCDIGLGIDTDCDLNGIPDLCDLLSGADCNSNGVLDACDISGGFSEDCDGNQVPDSCDIAGGVVDDDSNGIPDSCEPQAFRRGDLNTDGTMDVSDAVFGLEFLFGTQTVTCEDAADANDDGSLNIGDAVFILSALFNSGDLPPDPGSQNCGLDPTADSLGCELYEVCQ